VLPNPATDIINISCKNIFPDSYVIRDNMGRDVLINNIAAEQIQINLLNLSVGVYGLSILKDGLVIKNEKIIKY
jgi:hypothetical protein